jgi:hypothetical protein
MLVGFTNVGAAFGAWGAFALVAFYVTLSIVAEVAPDRLLRASRAARTAPIPRRRR